MKKRRRRTTPKTPRRKIEGVFDSKLESTLHHYWEQHYEATMIPQFRFHNIREWRFDFAFPDVYIAVEIQGFGTGHTSYEGMKRDYEKHNTAMAMGWGIIYIMSSDLQPLKIASTCALISSIIEHRRQNGAFLSAVKEMTNGRAIPKSSERRVNNIIEARRRILGGTDQNELPPRSDQVLRKGWPFDQ